MPSSSASDRPLILAANGVPQVRLHLRPNAAATEEFAAEEFRRHLHALAGAPPQFRRHMNGGPAVILNDPGLAAAAGIDIGALHLRPEQFHVETRGNQLFILGGGPRGLLYGVYEVLERLGCRWFTPETSVVPANPDVNLPPLRLTGGPAFEFRDTFCWEGGDPLWWVRNRLNGCYTVLPDYLGGSVEYGLFVHTFHTLVPPAEFGASHPEYYSLVHGARRTENAQLCLSNPAVLRILTERLLKVMREKPKATIFSVSQNDYEGYCECPACAAIVAAEGSQAGPVLRFVNAVAAETVKHHPDKLIDTLAYWYTLDAPRLTAPHPSVRVRLCPIRCCQGHPFGTCGHTENARFLRAIEGWGKLTKQLYIWHYCTNFAHYPLPMPDFDELAGNIAFYRRLGVYGVFMQGMGEDGGGAESMALRGYLVGKLLWQPDQPVWPLVDEFLAGVCGKAAPKVRAYHDLFHERVRRDPELHPSLYDPPSHGLFAGNIIGRADRLLAAGERQVKGAQRDYVRRLRHGLTYARLFRRTADQFRLKGDVYRGPTTPADLRAFDAVVKDWRRLGVQRVSEGAPFDGTVTKLRNALAPHPVVRLRAHGQELVVIPTLGGRLHEWHARGRQWLAGPDPGNHWTLYPMSEGYVEFAVPHAYSYFGWFEHYEYHRTAAGLELAATVGPGLRLTRSFALGPDGFTIASTLTNTNDKPQAAAWGGGLHLALGDADRVTFIAPAGAASYTPAELPDGLGQALTLEGDRAPAGAWEVTGPGYRLVHRFDQPPVCRAILGRVAARQTLALDLRTATTDLAPGAALAIRQEVRFIG